MNLFKLKPKKMSNNIYVYRYFIYFNLFLTYFNPISTKSISITILKAKSPE
jgi:hypothetical protein